MIYTAKSLYSWFDINREHIIKGHENQKVLLSENKVIDYFKDEHDALMAAKERNLNFGEFLIQWCVPKEEEYWCCFNQEVSFG